MRDGRGFGLDGFGPKRDQLSGGPTCDMDRRHGRCPHMAGRSLGLPLPNVHVSRPFSGNRVIDVIGIHSYFGEPLIYRDPISATSSSAPFA